MSQNDKPDNALPSTVFIRFLQKYKDEHPDKRASLSRHHPAVVCAVNSDLWCLLVDHFGGVTPFWRAFLPALKEWFDPNMPSAELQIVWGQFFISSAMASQAGMVSMDEVYDEYKEWFAPARKLFRTHLANVSLIPAVHVPRIKDRGKNPFDDLDLD